MDKFTVFDTFLQDGEYRVNWLSLVANRDGFSITSHVENIRNNNGLPADYPVLTWISEDPGHQDLDPDSVVVTPVIEGEALTGVIVTEGDVQPVIYLRLEFSGGDEEDPPGIVNDGVDGLNIAISLRDGPLTTDNLIPLSGNWRVTIRDDTGAIYDVVRVTLVGGQADVIYTSDARPAVCELRGSDLLPVKVGETTYQIRLVGNTTFKVYRVL